MTKHFPFRLFTRIVPSALLAILVSTALRADTVVLTNGDRLTGTAVKLEGGKLTFKTAYADAIAIAWDQVASLTTTQPMVLPTQNRVLSITALERTPAGLVVTTASGPSTIEAAAVTVLRSPADQKAYEDSLHPGWGHAWAGALNVSLALSRGNSETATFGTGLTMARQTLTDKTSLYAQLTTANSTSGGLRYDHNLNPRLFAFGTGDFSSDALQDLDLRSIMGGGFGWHPVKSPRQTLDILGGLVWTRETYSPGPTNSFAALDLGEQYTRKLGAASLFTEQMYFYPDMSQTGQYQFSFDSTFSSKLGKMFNWQTTFSDRYTSFPPAGTLKNDVILTTGLGITLARH
jgi:hypothetical protein